MNSGQSAFVMANVNMFYPHLIRDMRSTISAIIRVGHLSTCCSIVLTADSADADGITAIFVLFNCLAVINVNRYVNFRYNTNLFMGCCLDSVRFINTHANPHTHSNATHLYVYGMV